jgi:predicted glycosyltransferase
MRVWVDLTDASAVVFFAPIVRRLEDAGHTVTLTARRFPGADLVLRRYGLGGVLTTRHRGGGLGTRAVGLVNRTAQLLGSASSGRFDVACGSHASDFVLTARALAVPQMTFLDPDRLGRSNLVNVRLVDEVAVPDAVPVSALTDLGAAREKLFRYPGFKEEYYLYDAEPDADALVRLGIGRRRITGVVRPPAVRVPALAPAADEKLLIDVLRGLAGRHNVSCVVVARNRAQQRRILALGLQDVLVPDGPLDGVGLMAAADFVVGAGGTMLREAAALGTPAYTLSSSAGPVEASLLAAGRLTRLTDSDRVVLRKKDTRTADVAPRDPSLFVRRLIELVDGDGRLRRFDRFIRDASRQEPPPLL